MRLFLFNIRTNIHHIDTEFVYNTVSIPLCARVENDLGVVTATCAELNIFDRRAINGRSPIVDAGAVLVINTLSTDFSPDE